jgi:AbrB family looped-hinge helix DNA binding protein
MREEKIVTKIVKVGERGQIVIPKGIRRTEGIGPKSVLRITNYGAGNIVISKIKEAKSSEEKFLDILGSMKFPKNAWEQIQKERHVER